MKKKILAVLGDFYHSHDLALTAMQETVGKLEKNFGIQAELADTGVEDLKARLTPEIDLIVLYKENRINPDDENIAYWMTPELEEQITQYVSGGGSIFAWHSGIVSYEKNQRFNDMLRGYFLSHPIEREVRYSAADSNTGIAPASSFTVMDEHYLVNVNPLENSVFLAAESAEGKSVAGWAHEYGRGRVCCLTPTHRSEGMENEIMLDLLVECLRWCLKEQ
ncbi:trehalose utilization [Ruminiclostridium hungatei]|uniref:Trehalose utilization n=1 Tax=Ruminiclostridium hungatei TaxID=48256 RepID=A0A1V4SM99_RUMHU|nr:ThuA domain-containing protein [Ruminiclostridium hungatei]OPX44351.1 trehalose utilization [Ruminiclostridium hungatei]